jgi:hypothetical protein
MGSCFYGTYGANDKFLQGNYGFLYLWHLRDLNLVYVYLGKNVLENLCNELTTAL